jgi:predicted TIM-barrel fold metal-dependent hydrolase
VIDAHTHVVSNDAQRYPMKSAFGDGATQPHVVPFPSEELLSAQQACGVEGAILVQSFAAYGYDNSYAADVADAHPDRFVFVAGIDPMAPELLEHARHWIEDRGARGLRMLAFGPDFDPESMRPLWRLANDLHSSLCVLAPMMNFVRLAPLMRDFPELPIVLDHCGLEALDGTRADLGSPELCALSELSCLHMKISSRVFDAVQGSVQQAIVGLAERFGSDRLLWGSDFPASPEPSYARAIERATEVMAVFGPLEREQILAGTTRRLFRFE